MKKEIYLDNAASTKTPEAVITAMDSYYREYRANVHRGMYASAERATEAYEGARAKIAAFINSAPEETIFTKGTTEALNLLAYTLTKDLKAGDEIVVSIMEHHANLVPWQQAAKRLGLVLKFIPITQDYRLDMVAAKQMIGPKTKIVSVTQASNVLGTVNPVLELSELAHAAGAVIIVDAAQSAPHMPIDVKEIDCDFLVFSAHKMWGPTGVGVLWGRRALLEKMEPWQFGGDMILEVTKDHSTWNELPYKFEAGTPNISGVIGFGAAIDELSKYGMAKLVEEEKSLTAYALERLSKIEGLRIVGPVTAEDRVGAIAFTLEGIHPHDITTILDREGIAVRGGHHCAMPLLSSIGLEATTRASFYVGNTRADVDALVTGIEKVKDMFK